MRDELIEAWRTNQRINSYFIAHDSHHRGNMLLTLKECGGKLDKAGGYAIWDWDRR